MRAVQSITAVLKVQVRYRLDWARSNVPPNTLSGHIGDGFLRVKWPNQQCQSTEGRP